MAFLDDTDLTCPACDRHGKVTFVVGIGPNTRPGEGPAYRTLKDDGGWQVETKTAHPFFVGRLICPTCGAIVLEAPDGNPDDSN